MGCARGFMAAVDQLALLGRAVTFRNVRGIIEAIFLSSLVFLIAQLKSERIDFGLIHCVIDEYLQSYYVTIELIGGVTPSWAFCNVKIITLVQCVYPKPTDSNS
jgi:hypothetical protein